MYGQAGQKNPKKNTKYTYHLHEEFSLSFTNNPATSKGNANAVPLPALAYEHQHGIDLVLKEQ